MKVVLWQNSTFQVYEFIFEYHFSFVIYTF